MKTLSQIEAFPQNEIAVEELLSRPTSGVLASLEKLTGDIVILGVAGKMGVTLSMMARRALDELGRKDKVIGVARFSDPTAATRLNGAGIETVKCDLLDREQIRALPDAPNVLFLAGQKFGTSSGPELTWAMNTLVPANACEKYASSRIVAFSTGCVYPLVPITSGGARENHDLAPPGDYANSCVGRERIFTHYSKKNGTPVSIYRLNYAIDFRYGVLLDIAQKVWNSEAVDVTMGHANVIWQGDANAQAIQCLEHAANPPQVFNVTGPEVVSLRALANRFGTLFDKEVTVVGQEAETAWLSHSGKANSTFGYPSVALDTMTEWVAQWVQNEGKTLGKPTHFEEREGKF
ncbi:MAG TPA: NAD-dependent epimerase/dehydratase family protein [Abditibacteriaceae bacterium]|jgi:nucleoside-diphosphate-sugar epimerase